MRRNSILIAGFFALLASASLGAQERPDLERGDRVRVWIPSNSLAAQIATVDSVSPGGLTLRIPRMAFPLMVPMDSIARLDIPGRGGRSVASGAAIGGLIGLGAGLAVMAGVYATPCSSDSECEVLFFGAAPVGVLTGALLGGFSAADPWTRVWPRP